MGWGAGKVGCQASSRELLVLGSLSPLVRAVFSVYLRTPARNGGETEGTEATACNKVLGSLQPGLRDSALLAVGRPDVKLIFPAARST